MLESPNQNQQIEQAAAATSGDHYLALQSETRRAPDTASARGPRSVISGGTSRMQGNLAAQAMLKPPDATGYNVEARDDESFGDDADQQQMLSPGEQRAMNEQFLG